MDHSGVGIEGRARPSPRVGPAVSGPMRSTPGPLGLVTLADGELDGVEDVFVGDAVLACAIGNLHNDRLPCHGTTVKVTCQCSCHKVIQPGLVPCPTCDQEPELSSR